MKVILVDFICYIIKLCWENNTWSDMSWEQLISIMFEMFPLFLRISDSLSLFWKVPNIPITHWQITILTWRFLNKVMVSTQLFVSGAVAPDRVLFVGQIELFNCVLMLNCVLILNWIVWNKTTLTFKLYTNVKLNCLK